MASVMSDSVTPWTVAHQAALSTGFSKQEYWSRLPFPPPGDLPDQGPNPCLLCLLHRQAGSLSLVPPGKPLRSDTLGQNPGSATSQLCDSGQLHVSGLSFLP